MDKQGKHTKLDDQILDFSAFSSPDSHEYLTYNKDITWPGSTTNVKKNYNLRIEEEMKIRQELEIDVETDLEEEIKDGIYHLALRLHRLYRHRNERSTNYKRDQLLVSKNEGKYKAKDHDQTADQSTLLSEVNINIKMEGGTKIEIKESKKNQDQQPQKIRPRSSRSSAAAKTTSKKFDWVNSLRSANNSGGLVIMNKKIHGNQASLMSNDGGAGGGYRQQQRGLITVNNDREPLELGWKF